MMDVIEMEPWDNGWWIVTVNDKVIRFFCSKLEALKAMEAIKNELDRSALEERLMTLEAAVV